MKKVKQMRGPGMNLGLKKPRFGKFRTDGTPHDVTPPSKGGASGGPKRSYSKVDDRSYLSPNLKKW